MVLSFLERKTLNKKNKRYPFILKKMSFTIVLKSIFVFNTQPVTRHPSPVTYHLSLVNRNVLFLKKTANEKPKVMMAP